ncbi:dsRNA-binding domain-like protein, partial [Macroventuria anomochaeta]
QVDKLLSMPAAARFVSERQGPGGRTLRFLQGHHALELANLVFGFDGWSSEVGKAEVVPADFLGDRSVARPKMFVRCHVRVVLAEHLGSAHREDTGYGSSFDNDPYMAFQNAAKEAVTNGLKRALAQFGESTGGCFKDAAYLGWARKERESQG